MKHPLAAILSALALTTLHLPAQAQYEPNSAEPWNWSEEYIFEQVNRVRAGRDLNPDSWPGGARVAVLLSYDVDNETVMGLRTGDGRFRRHGRGRSDACSQLSDRDVLNCTNGDPA